MMKLVAIALPAFLLASAAAAEVNTSPAGTDDNAAAAGRSAPVQAEDDEDEDRRVCRRVETNTGSRVPHRLVCLTASEWRARERN